MHQGALYHLLANPIYIGKIRHKEENYNGLHDAIIGEDLWIRVQERLASQRVTRKARSNTSNASPLAGKVFDQNGQPLTPSHATKAGKRYRYYISKTTRTDSGETWRLSAASLEAAILQAVTTDRELTLQAQRAGVALFLNDVIPVTIEPASLVIKIASSKKTDGHTIHAPYQLRRCGVEMKMVLPGQPPAEPDIILIKRILKAMNWIERLKHVDTISKIAEDENITPSHITHHIDLGYVSPKISPVWEEQDAIFLD